MVNLNKKIVIIASSIIIIFIVIFSITFVIYQNKKIEPVILIEHDPIIILKDMDFESYNFPGKGTINNPYLIQNYNITTEYGESIYISGTTKHFIIQNCYLNSYYANIMIDNTNGSKQIIGNDIEGAHIGLRIINSPSLVIENNNISIVPYDIDAEPLYNFNTDIDSSENSLIRNNIFTHGKFELTRSYNVTIDKNGFYLSNHDNSNSTFHIEYYNVTISENFFASEGRLEVNAHNVTILGNFFASEGHLEVNAPDAKIIGNIFEDGGSIEVDSSNSIISNNQISNGGYAIYDATSTVENNLVNDKELGFFVNLENEIFSVDTYGQYIFVECMNLTIRDLNVRNTSYGILIVSSNNITLSNNTFTDGHYGIGLYHTYNCTIKYNLVKLNIIGGIYLDQETENITIHHNAFIDNGELEGSQAEDYGENNFFYDVNTLEGNFWSNWGGGTYWIVGGNYDLYPLASNPL